MDHRADQEKAGPAGGERPGSFLPGIVVQTGVALGLSGSGTPAPLVLVAHSMGGLVARRAVENLGPRLGGLLLVDPTPETAPV